MLKSLRRKLILLYTCSTGLILTSVLVFVMIINNRQLIESKKASFQNNYMNVNQSIQTDNEVSHLWLSELEINNNLIIRIEDNGNGLLYNGAWQPPTDRQLLVDRVKKAAEEDNIHTDIRPVSQNKLQSRIYEITGDRGDHYFGEVFVISLKSGGYRSVTMLQYITDYSKEAVMQKLFIVLLDLLGIAGLYFVSRWIVGKSLKPVEESRRRQTQFIASASHELKSPLSVIRANASALLVEPERAEHFTKGIDKECRRLSALIEDMLLLASADAKSWRLKKEIIDMDLLLIETCDSFYPLCKESGKELRLLLPDEMLPRVEGDSMRMKQILAALIDNAITYSEGGDRIILRAYTRKNHLMLEVEDHGIGIDPDKKKDVFEKFYRGDMSRKDKNHFGLGLSIVKELTELHGGSISLRDTPGGGATFIISLPVRNQPSMKQDEAASRFTCHE
jgi:signal transduction histidine kinase